jgi:aryl-alcohol dehydrogenase-like predicted oxidoreductase
MRIGFGTARTAPGSSVHENSLKKALAAGVNLIDTSSNYGDGLSEKPIREVLKRRPNAGRDGVTLVSKFGYIQGAELENVKNKGPGPDTSELDDAFHHCIHPSFMKNQLTSTLERLDVESLEVYLLHNPEYFLADALQLNQGPASADGRGGRPHLGRRTRRPCGAALLIEPGYTLKTSYKPC